MAIAIKSIKNVSIFAGDHNREIDCYDGRYFNISLHFEAGDYRYHVWLMHTVANGWHLDAILYKNLIVQPEFGRHKTGHLQVDAHRTAVDHAINVMEIGTFSDGKVIGLDSAAITRLVDTHNAGVRREKEAAQAKADADRASAIRAALLAHADTLTDPVNINALITIANNSPERELNALDKLFHSI